MSKKRECYLCGEQYYYCSTCSNDRLKPSWMSEFHSESCKNIFDICTRFNLGVITKLDAQEALQECDLSKRANFKSFVKNDLDVIFAPEPKKKRTKKAEPVEANEQVEIQEPVVEAQELIITDQESHEVVNNTEE